MRILHYSLGLYPKRRGGLNRYATDLMLEQSKEHHVALLYPYEQWLRGSRCYVARESIDRGIIIYRLINALPIPLQYGVKQPKYMQGCLISFESFERFYNDFHPDVLHLHTLMGIPETALAFFKQKGVRIILTTHDYYGICTKVNMIDRTGEVCIEPIARKCADCNKSAPLMMFLRLRNSPLAFKIRDLEQWLKNLMSF